ncbi:MAG: hypothetical protein U0930_03860 [Pirellulales bacterium]
MLFNSCDSVPSKVFGVKLKLVTINCLVLAFSCNIGCQRDEATSQSANATVGQNTQDLAAAYDNTSGMDVRADAQTASNGDADQAPVAGKASQASISFRTAPDTGIDFKRQDDMRGQNRIFESTGGGVGVIDLITMESRIWFLQEVA